MHPTLVQHAIQSKLQRIERIMIIGLIILVVLVSIFDIIEDHQQGSEFIDLFGDVLFMSVFVLVLSYLFRITPLSLIRHNVQLEQEVSNGNQQAIQWQQRASKLMTGLGNVISEQFNSWNLSLAEKEVALLLLKGLSHSEIAEVRDTKSRTVRQQAASIYQKANLSGRAELSAFFLEDLWLPDRKPK